MTQSFCSLLLTVIYWANDAAALLYWFWLHPSFEEVLQKFTWSFSIADIRCLRSSVRSKDHRLISILNFADWLAITADSNGKCSCVVVTCDNLKIVNGIKLCFALTLWGWCEAYKLFGVPRYFIKNFSEVKSNAFEKLISFIFYKFRFFVVWVAQLCGQCEWLSGKLSDLLITNWASTSDWNLPFGACCRGACHKCW
jgi:hypothetical protein